MNLNLDFILTNEYAFTFLFTFLGITLKGLYNNHEHFKSALMGEAYDLAPELVFIAISFAVSFYTQVLGRSPDSPILFLDKILILHLLVLAFVIVLLKRMGSDNTRKNPVKSLIIPLLLGFTALFVVLTFTHLNYE
jgi:RsiW-degrading membrane proteinase PrsW (M82 family)